MPLLLFGFPPFSDKTDLHLDIASAVIALVALAFSVWSFLNEKRLSLARMRLERDNGLIGWINATIETIVEAEFLLRDALREPDAKGFARRRDALLMKLATAIDKGRLYFPAFSLDVAVNGTELDPLSRGHGVPLLDRLVEGYDLVKDLAGDDAEALKSARHQLLVKKREFVLQAQSQIEPERRWTERGRRKELS